MDEAEGTKIEALEKQFSSGRYLDSVPLDDGTLLVRTEWGYHVVKAPDQA